VPKLQVDTLFVKNGGLMINGLKEEKLLQTFFSSIIAYYKDLKEDLFADFC